MALTTVALTPRIGTEIKSDAKTLLSGVDAAEIRALLQQRGVIIFRDLGLDDGQMVAFAGTLGTVRLGTNFSEGERGVMKVTFDREENPAFAAYYKGTFYWHMDGTHDDVPPLASILTPRVLSPTGGHTEFANTYAAYDDLPDTEKEFLGRLRVVHTQEAGVRDEPADTEEEVRHWRSFAPKTHPLVWRHRSGRKSLVLSRSGLQVVGMDRKESDALLDRLMEWGSRPEYVYHHRWRMGDVLMWNNTGTMHRVLPYDRECGRRLHRVTLEGEEPLAA